MALDAAQEALEPLAAKVWSAVARHDLRGRTVTLKVKFSDFQQITRARSLGHAVASQDELLSIARDLAAGVLPDPRGARLLGVTLSGFEVPDDGPAQLSLFD